VTYFDDLAPCTYLGPSRGCALAVGWLEAGHDYAHGRVEPDIVAALARLFEHAWEPVTTHGWHDCSLCARQPEDGPITREIAGQRELLGVKNLLVPFRGVIYAAPSLIIHYIEAHGYRPPDAFVEALGAIDPTAAHYRAECERLWFRGYM
jgi:hypothetical protein